MLRGIITLIISAGCISSFGQISFTDSLLHLEERIYRERDEQARGKLLLRKFEWYIEHNEYTDEGLKVVVRIDPKYLDSAEHEDFHWNAALYSYILRNYEKASNHLNRYNSQRKVRVHDEVLLQYLITAQLDTLKSNAYLKELVEMDTAYRCLKCITSIQSFEGKKPGPYVVSSAFLPGSGMIFHGNVGKGLVSLGIHGGIAVAIVAMVRWNVYLNAVSWGMTLLQKFYFGNLKLTNKLVEISNAKKKEKLADNCELSMEKILGELNFR